MSILFSLLLAASIFWLNKQFVERDITCGNYSRMQIGMFGLGIFSCLIVYLTSLVAGYVMTDVTLDGRAYHLPVIHEWLLAGRVKWLSKNFEWAAYMNGYPKAVEAFLYLWVGATGDPRWGNTGNLYFLPLGVVGIAVIARVLGVRTILAWFVGLLFVLVPANIAQSTQCYVDTAHGAAAIASLAVMLVFLKQNKQTNWPGHRQTLLMLGLALGLAAGTKGQGLIVAFVTVLACWCAVWYGERRQHSVSFRLRQTFEIGLLTGIGCLLVGGFWYVNAWIQSGNPFYPVGVEIAGYEIFKGLHLEDALAQNIPNRVAGSPRWLQILYVWSQLDGWPMNLRRVDPRSAGLGFLWVVGCLPAVVVLMKKNWNSRHHDPSVFPLVSVLVGTVGVIFLLSPSNWWPRFVLILFGAGLPAFGYVICLYGSKPYWRTWISVCMIMTAVETFFCLYWFVRPAMVRPLAREPLAIMSPAAWRESLSFYAPNHARDRLWPGIGRNEPVAIYEGRDVTAVGDLGMNLGHGAIHALGSNPTEAHFSALIASGVQKVIWNHDVIPLSLETYGELYGLNSQGMKLYVINNAVD